MEKETLVPAKGGETPNHYRNTVKKENESALIEGGKDFLLLPGICPRRNTKSCGRGEGKVRFGRKRRDCIFHFWQEVRSGGGLRTCLGCVWGKGNRRRTKLEVAKEEGESPFKKKKRRSFVHGRGENGGNRRRKGKKKKKKVLREHQNNN